jgi:RNA polymerase sigma-70 factor, ECF subfamily
LAARPDERNDSAGAAPASRIAAALYERYRHDVYTYCHRRLRDPEEAEDAMQVTFLKAFAGLRNGAVPRVDNAWLFTIATRVVLTRLEVANRLRAVEETANLDEIAEERAGPAERTDMDDVWRAIKALAETPRRALLMRELQGLQYDEIAEELGLDRSHVGVMLFRTRSRLASSLAAPTLHPVRDPGLLIRRQELVQT